MLFCSIKGANRGYIQVLLATSRNRIYFRRRSTINLPPHRKVHITAQVNGYRSNISKPINSFLIR
ncbi:hypothetical protein [Cardinium endosymbiont of Tipula unca]|uniref:hypothetical protein n=1 Tax=Cardinium endosymbiont of Tipula unca TaxID=3066216 RepID=UPI0030CB3AFB